MCTRTSRRPSMWCPSRVTASTFRPMANCACFAAAPAATSGRHSPRACRNRTAKSTCCAMPWPSTRSINAASISAPPAARSTPPPTLETAGPPLSAICQRSCRSKCRRCPDSSVSDGREGTASAVPFEPAMYHGTGDESSMIRVILPPHLRTLAQVRGDVELEVQGPVTQRSVLDALELRYPMLCGTIRDQVTQQRRPFLRFFACEEDLSHLSPDTPLPHSVASGSEPLIILGAIAGG